MDTECDVVKVTLSKGDMQKYKLYDNRRMIRNSQVLKLRSLLMNGKHFDTPIAVNKKGNTYWILDGNHRYEALMKFFKEKPKAKVNIWEMVYHIKDPAREKQKYIDLNSGIRPTGDDFIKQYIEDAPVFKNFIENSSCISIYISQNRPIKARTLLHVYEYVKTDKNRFEPMNALDLIENAKSWTKKDINLVDAFLLDFETAYGKLVKENRFTRLVPFAIIFRLWYVNRNRIPYESMIRRMKKLIGHPYFEEYSRMGGRPAVVIGIHRFKEIMDKGFSKKLIIEKGDKNE